MITIWKVTIAGKAAPQLIVLNVAEQDEGVANTFISKTQIVACLSIHTCYVLAFYGC